MPIDGILLVDKGVGETSFSVVARAKAALRGRGVRKVGHAGTLDPFATGLLVLLLGQGTKLSPFLMAGKKRYCGTMRLGVETDTLDREGAVTARRVVVRLSREEILQTAGRYVGRLEQIPPAYSAVRHGGTRAYKLARRGMRPELRARTIEVESIDIQRMELPFVGFEVVCSAGTYVRRLAADLGEELGPGAHLASLRRLQSGAFDVDAAMPSSAIEEIGEDSALEKRLLSLSESLPDIPAVEVDKPLADKIRRGYQPTGLDLGLQPGWKTGTPGAHLKILWNGDLVALLEINGNRGLGYERLSISRVFS